MKSEFKSMFKDFQELHNILSENQERIELNENKKQFEKNCNTEEDLKHFDNYNFENIHSNS